MTTQTIGRTAAACMLALGITASANAADYSSNQVLVGVLTDMSAAYSPFGGKGTLAGAELAIEDFGGKVNGMPVKLISADHQNKPDVASAKAREWSDQRHVDLIVGLINSGVAIAVQNVAADKRVITMNTASGSTSLHDKFCSPYAIQFTYDTHAMPTGTASAVMDQGGKSWYFISADYAFGHSLYQQSRKVIEANGGKVLGNVKAPIGTTDFSSYLISAKNSGAQVIGLANAGPDFVNAVKQAREFGIVSGGQQLAGMMGDIKSVHSIGQDTARGLKFTTAFYWDRNEASRSFGKRFYAKTGDMPDMMQAGAYSAVKAYLATVKAAGTDDPDAVREQLGRMTVDFFGVDGHIRKDGLMVHDMFLAQVKDPDEVQSKDAPGWDMLRIVKVIPGEQAFAPLSESTQCSLLK